MLPAEGLPRTVAWLNCLPRAGSGRLSRRYPYPMEDVRIIRANYARELILGTSLPLKEIAPRAGLGNEYAMSRIFRRYFNMPPGAWRRHRSLTG